MPSKVFLVMLLCVGAFCCTLQDQAAPKSDPSKIPANIDVKKTAAANTDFGFRLLRQLVDKKPTDNIFFSPFSISSALAMAMNGAEGLTKQDIGKTLGLSTLAFGEVNQANRTLLSSLTHPDSQEELSIANAIWAGQNMTFAPAFQESCRRFYNARASRLDLPSSSSAAIINGWTSKNTHGKINHLVTDAEVDDASAVLTNAVYFHGLWVMPFKKSETHEATFTLPSGHTTIIPLMYQTGTVSYLQTANFQAASLPYDGGCMRMYVFLPTQGTTIDAFTQSLTASRWQTWLNQMKPTALALFLPRFKADFRSSLKEPLSSLGMGSAFGPGANFRPMGIGLGFIGDVIHQSVLDVDEEGTVAAGATAVIMIRGARHPSSTILRIDHPFFCAILDTATGTILFEGVIRDPK